MEKEKKMDRRVIRTKKALQAALNELVSEKGYTAITIEEITTRANLGRTTFYLHYKDKEDLLLESIQEHLFSIVNEIADHSIKYWIQESDQSINKFIFETIKKNSDIYAFITQEQSNKVYERFQKIILSVTMKLINESPWAQKKSKLLSIPVDFLINYYSGAMWASIVWWAKNNFEQSVDEMVNSFRILFFPGIAHLLNGTKMNDLLENP